MIEQEVRDLIQNELAHKEWGISIDYDFYISENQYIS